MSVLPEFIGTVHIILGPYRGNPIGLYLLQDGDTCRIAPHIYPWNRIIGKGETTNKAAADFEAKWKESGLADEMYTGPHWEGGIKPEKPKPPPKPATPPPSSPPEAKPVKTEVARSDAVAPKSNPSEQTAPSESTAPAPSKTLNPPAPPDTSPTGS